MKKLIALSLLTILLTSCNTVLLIRPSDVFYIGMFYIFTVTILASICSTGKDFRKHFLLNLFLTPIYGIIYLQWNKKK